MLCNSSSLSALTVAQRKHAAVLKLHIIVLNECRISFAIGDICGVQKELEVDHSVCSAYTTQRNFMFLLPSGDFTHRVFVQSTPQFTSYKKIRWMFFLLELKVRRVLSMLGEVL